MISIYKVPLRIIVIILFILQINFVFSCRAKEKYIHVNEKNNKKVCFHLLDKQMASKRITNVLTLYNCMQFTKSRSFYFYDISSCFIYSLCKIVLESTTQNSYNKLLLNAYVRSVEYLNLVYSLPGAGLEPA